MATRAQEQLADMVEFMSGVMHGCNEYPVVEPGYKFNDSALDNRKDRHIFLRNHDGEEFLIVNNTASYPTKDYKAKIIAASIKNINIGFILYKGNIDGGLEDAYWRRESAHGQHRYSTRHVGNTAGNAIAWLTGLEKDVAKMHSGHVIYYQPESARLKKSLRVFKTENVRLKYNNHQFARNTDSKSMKQMVERVSWERFYFTPRKLDAHSKLLIANSLVGVNLDIKIASPREDKD